MRPKLNKKQKEQIKKYILKEGASLTSHQLGSLIEERFGIKYSKSSAHRLLRSLGFSYITPRPRYYKKDKKAQERFKKKITENDFGKPRIWHFVFR